MPKVVLSDSVHAVHPVAGGFTLPDGTYDLIAVDGDDLKVSGREKQVVTINASNPAVTITDD